jgi:hypothetical protein
MNIVPKKREMVNEMMGYEGRWQRPKIKRIEIAAAVSIQ